MAHPQEIIEFLDQHWCAKATADAAPNTMPDKAVRRLLELRRSYLESLSAMPHEDLVRELHDALSEQDQDRPFNKFGTEADFEHFGRCAYLTPDEAVALSLGKDPRFVNWAIVKPYLGTSLFALDYANRLDLVERAIAWGELPKLLTPLQFLTWAHQFKVPVPDELIHCTFARGEPIKYWHDLCEEIENELLSTKDQLQAAYETIEELQEAQMLETQQTFEEWLATQDQIEQLNREHEEEKAALHEGLEQAQKELEALRQHFCSANPVSEKVLTTTERNSLLTIAIAAAVDGYGHDPKSKKNSAPREIADSAVRLGLKLTDETVLKYLKEAAGLENFVSPAMLSHKPKSRKRKPKSG